MTRKAQTTKSPSKSDTHIKTTQVASKKQAPKSKENQKKTNETPKPSLSTAARQKKEAAKAREEANEAVRKRAAEMLAEEASDEEDVNSHRKKRLRKRVVPETEDEREDASDVEREQSGGDFEGSNESGEDDAARLVLFSDDNESGEGSGENPLNDDDESNGMIVDEVTQTPKKRKRKSSSRSRRPHSSRSSSESSSTTGSKVKLSQFTPVSARLANASHYGMRVAISVGAQGSFPENDKELTLKVIGDAVSAEPSLLDKFEAVQHDPVGLETLLKYTWGAATQIRGELKTKTKSVIAAWFGIPGDLTQPEIVSLVTWLLENGNFKYGGLNTQARTYDVQRPLGHPIIKDLIVKQWFASGKGEGIRHPSAKLFKNIPPTLIALVLTSVENALMEFKFKGHQLGIAFSKELVKLSYNNHLNSTLALQEKSPKWFAKWQKDLYESMLKNTKFSHLLDDSDETDVLADFKEVDFDALEASVN